MAQPIDMVNNAAVTATGAVAMKGEGSAVTKIPSRGHYHWALTAKETGAGTATVTLKGTNNPDPADTNGETLITLSNTGNDQKDGSAASKGYKYVFVHVTAAAAPMFAAEGGIRLYGTGFSGHS